MDISATLAKMRGHLARAERLILPDVTITLRCSYQLGVHMRLK